jgi:hypothetical protein
MKQASLFEAQHPTLTVFSFGAGQDSACIRELLIGDPDFRAKYAPGRLLVLMSDTGDEHDDTYIEVERSKKRFKEHGIEFHFITADMGYHAKSWQSLRHFYRSKTTIGSKAFSKSCTDQLKIKPLYSFLESWLSREYGVQTGRKKGFYEFAATHSRVRVLIGLAAGEEKRIADQAKNPNKWFRECIEVAYPLIDLGMNRQDCQDYVRQADQIVPPPSNCVLCPWCSLTELEYMRRFDPVNLSEWIALEKAKLDKYAHLNRVPVYKKGGEIEGYKNKNLGVFGVKSLPIKVEEARLKHLDWSDEQIRDYKFSHGHCTSSRY